MWTSAGRRTGYIMKAQYRMRQRYNQTLPREENDEDGGGCTSTGKAAFCCFGTLQGYILVSRVRALMVWGAGTDDGGAPALILSWQVQEIDVQSAEGSWVQHS